LIEHTESTDVLRNDPVLAGRLKRTLQSALGEGNVAVAEPSTTSEDFSYFIAQGIPSAFFALGAADPQKFAQAAATGEELPSNHSPLFAPDVDPALRTGIAAEVVMLRNLLSGSAEDLRRSTEHSSVSK
jgi:hippurate hydrolase